MTKRISSFLLALVMVVLAIPAFVLPAAAVEVPTDYSTSWLANHPSVNTDTGVVTYPSTAWSIGYKPSVADFVLFGKYASAGGVFDKLICSTGEDQWGNGGYYSVGYDKSNHVAIVAGQYVAYRYVAEYAGKATVSVNALYMASGGSTLSLTGEANSAFAIAVNGTVIWPENATYADKTTWYYNPTVAVNVADDIPNLAVSLNTNDTVEFLFAKVGSGSWSHYGFDPSVTYSTFNDDIQLPYTAKWTDCLPWVSDRANGVVTMPEGPWGVGRLYNDGRFQLYAYSHDTREDIIGVIDGGIWDHSGMFMSKNGRSRYMIVPGSTKSAVRYTAEYTGTATFAVSSLIVDAGHSVCLMQNGQIIWPANATSDASTWYIPTTNSADIASEIPDITVNLQKGDSLDFVVGGWGDSDAGWGAGNLYPTVTYYAVEGFGLTAGELNPPLTSSTTSQVKYDAVHREMYTDGAWTPIQYDIVHLANASNAKNLTSIKRTSNGWYVQPAGTGDGHNGGWASFMVSGSGWAPTNYFSMPENVSAGWRYSVPATGVYSFNVDALKQGVGCTTAENVKDAEFAVFVNNEKVWPAGDAWYTLADANVDYAADANAAIGTALTNITLNAGDRVEFLLKGLGGAWNCVVLGQFSATQTERTVAAVTPVPDFEFVSVSLDEKFAANFYYNLAALPEGATDIGAYVDGEFVAADEEGIVTVGDVAAKELADRFEIQPVCTYEGEEYTGEITKISLAEILLDYATYEGASEKIRNIAIATLNYGAAAQIYFGYNTENLANAGLSEEQKNYGPMNTYADGSEIETNPTEARIASIYGVKLILNDAVDVAIYFRSSVDLTEGYRLLLTDDPENIMIFDATFTKVEGTEDLYKVIAEGCVPSYWNTDFYFAVAEAGTDTIVSDALCYSITDYCVRMQNTAIDDVVDAMLALYEAAAAFYA